METTGLPAAAAAVPAVPSTSGVKKKDLHIERCLFMKDEVQLPVALIESSDIFSTILNEDTWKTTLNENQRKHLMKFLPSFPENDAAEKQATVRQIFEKKNFKFGNPLDQFQAKLRDGMFSPDIAKYAALYKKARVKEYRYQQQVYYNKLLKDILLNRQTILEQVNKTPVDEPLHLEVMKYQPPPKEKSLDTKVRRRYLKILREIGEECGEDVISSEDEEAGQAVKARKPPKPASPTLMADGPPSRVVPTFTQRMHLTNGDLAGGTQRPSPMTDDDLRDMLRKHRKRRYDSDASPDMDTRGLTVQDVMSRTQPLKKLLTGKTGAGLSMKKKVKDKPERLKKKVKVKEEETSSVSEMALPVLGDIPQDESAMDGLNETEESVAGLLAVDGSQSVSGSGMFSQYLCFFSLLRDFICEDPEAKISTMKLEEKVREWQDSGSGALSTWFRSQANWVDMVLPALKFLSGDVIGMTLDNFIPYLDYKERAQQWKWIGQGRDLDQQMGPLYQHWLDNKDLVSIDCSDRIAAVPPPPRQRTNYQVRPSSEEDKGRFREQEEQRFRNANRAFTYVMHGYESVVGPVKGVYANENQMTKARDHALLVKERPAFVTILTLVRDAAARLPNGEGTRSDICELLKDSQFLAPGVTDAQINTVVSGALDRLHYEKDPCVKYDVNRKLWIYLHRSRTEDEFERIHQAQGAAAKAKKALQKPKPSKKIKESVQSIQATLKAAGITTPIKPTLDLSKATSPAGAPIPDSSASSSPRTPQQSPRSAFGHSSPRASQSSPKVVMAGVSVSPSASRASPKSVAAMVQQMSSQKSAALTQGRPVSLTLLQAQEALKSQATSLITTVHTPGTPTSVLAGTPQVLAGSKPVLAGSKPVAFSLIQAAANGKAVDSSGQKVVFTTRTETVAQKLAASSQAAQIQLVTTNPRATTASSLLTSQARVTVPSSVPGGKPVVAKIVQQGTMPQQVAATLGGVVTATTGAKQATGQHGTTTIKIQGGSIMHGGKPVSVQRSQSIDATATTKGGATVQDIRSATLLQRLHSVEGTEVKMADPGVSMVTAAQGVGKPLAQVSLGRGGKPATLLITKPGTAPGGKGASQQIAGSVTLSGNETVAQLIQNSAMAGRQTVIGGKPILIGGKPAMISGKPIQIGGKPLQLIGKTGLGVLQGHPGLVSPINFVSQASSAQTSTTQATRVFAQNQTSLVGQLLPQGGAAALLQHQQVQQKGGKAPTSNTQGQVAMATAAAAQLQTKIVTPGQGGIMVTQLPTQGKHGRGTSTASCNAPKLLTASQAGLLASQILVHPTQSQAKIGHQVIGAGARQGATVRPTLVTTQGGKNIQVVKTVFSQPGGKPAQSTIVLPQSGTQSVMASGLTSLTAEQLTQAGVRPVSATGTKGKPGPVYARIITPPPNIRLANVRPGQLASMPGVSVLQAVGQLPADATQILTQIPIATQSHQSSESSEETETSQ